MAMEIGDGNQVGEIRTESCRDRPIYVRAWCCGEENRSRWYVIEERPSSAITSDDDILDCESDSDIITRISVPNTGVSHNSLFVLGSRIYLIGGDYATDDNADYKTIAYKYFELGQKPEWEPRGGNLERAQFNSAAIGHDGFIYSAGYDLYRMSPDTGIPKQLPLPDRLSCTSHLLALTMTKLFIHVTYASSFPSLMFSYDLERDEWDENYPDMWGTWSAGVVFYDRYMLAFGSQNPRSPPAWYIREFPQLAAAFQQPADEFQEMVAGIYVFDLQERKWLPKPVQGLPNDGKVLPHTYVCETNEPTMFYTCPGYSPYLFQVGNDQKLALLWGSLRPYPNSGECVLINWSKFILNPITIDAAIDDPPHFYVTSLSTGFAPLDEGTHKLLNCATGM